MQISNSINNKPAFKASFDKEDFDTRNIISNTMYFAPSAKRLYLLHKMMGEMNSKDQFTLSADYTGFGDYNYNFKNKNNGEQVSATEDLIGKVTDIATQNKSKKHKLLFNDNKEIKTTFQDVVNELKNKFPEENKKLNDINSKMQKLRIELDSLEEEKKEIKNDLNDKERNYIREQILG